MTQNANETKTAADIMSQMKVAIDLKLSKRDLVKYLVSEHFKPLQAKLNELNEARKEPVDRYNKLFARRDARAKEIVQEIADNKRSAVTPIMLQLHKVVTGVEPIEEIKNRRFVSVYGHEVSADGTRVMITLNIIMPNGTSYSHYAIKSEPDAELTEIQAQLGLASIELHAHDDEITVLTEQLDSYRSADLEAQIEAQLVAKAFEGLQLPEDWAKKLLPQMGTVDKED